MLGLGGRPGSAGALAPAPGLPATALSSLASGAVAVLSPCALAVAVGGLLASSAWLAGMAGMLFSRMYWSMSRQPSKMAALDSLGLLLWQSSMLRRACRHAPPMALASASLRSACLAGVSMPSASQPLRAHTTVPISSQRVAERGF